MNYDDSNNNEYSEDYIDDIESDITNQIETEDIEDERLPKNLVLGKEKLEYIGYVRQSKKDNSEYTLDAQEGSIRSYAKHNGIKIGLIITEERSGMKANKRPEFIKMVELLNNDYKKKLNKQYGGIIFFDVSRLARNSEDFLAIEKIRQNGYKLISIRENITDSSAGSFMLRTLQAEAIYYSERQSSKTTQYKVYISKADPYSFQGGNNLNYGYTTKSRGNGKSKMIIIHPFESQVIRKIYELAGNGKTNKIISEIIEKEFKDELIEFNKQNSSLQTNIPNEKRVSDIILNKGSIKYKGIRLYCFNVKFEDDLKILNNYYELTKRNKLHKGINWVESYLQDLQIIDNDLYEAVCIGRRNSIDNKKVGLDLNLPIYTGFLKCSCGADITGQKGGRGNKYRYSCRNAMLKNSTCNKKTVLTEEEINKSLYKNIFSKLDFSELYDIILNSTINSSSEELKNNIRILKGNLTKLSLKKKEIEQFDENGIEINKISIAEYKEINKKISTIKEKIEYNEKEIENIGLNNGLKLDKLINNIKDFNKLGPKSKRQIAGIIIQGIVFDEINNDEHLYINPKDTTKTIKYQKIVKSITLNPIFQLIYNYNTHEDSNKLC